MSTHGQPGTAVPTVQVCHHRVGNGLRAVPAGHLPFGKGEALVRCNIWSIMQICRIFWDGKPVPYDIFRLQEELCRS